MRLPQTKFWNTPKSKWVNFTGSDILNFVSVSARAFIVLSFNLHYNSEVASPLVTMVRDSLHIPLSRLGGLEKVMYYSVHSLSTQTVWGFGVLIPRQMRGHVQCNLICVLSVKIYCRRNSYNKILCTSSGFILKPNEYSCNFVYC